VHADRGADGHVAAATPGAAPGIAGGVAAGAGQAGAQLGAGLGAPRACPSALAAAAGLSSSRVHQIVAAAGLDELDAALGELRAARTPNDRLVTYMSATY
jgi:hypothetical protein